MSSTTELETGVCSRWQNLVLPVIAIALFLMKFGLTRIPNFGVSIVMFTQSPDGELLKPIVNGHYLTGSWLGPAMFYVLNIRTDENLFIIYSAMSLGALTMASLLVRRQGAEKSEILLKIASLPFLPVVFYWVGYDSLLVLLLLVAFALRNSRLALVGIGILVGLQHAEIGFIAGLQALLYLSITTKALENRKSNWWPAWFLLGVSVGRIFLVGILRALNTPSESRSQLAIDLLFERLAGIRASCTLSTMRDCFPVMAGPLLLSVIWPFVFVSLFLGISRKQLILAIMSCCSFALILTAPVLDQTRIAVLSLTFVSLLVVHDLRGTSWQRNRRSAWFALCSLTVWLVTPMPWIWDGQIRWFGFFDGIRSSAASIGM